MTEQSPDPSEGRPVYEDSLPLVWETVETKPDIAQVALIQRSNEEILKAIYALDEGYVENEDPHDSLVQQMMRMDAKINFLMSMVGQLLSESLIIPELRSVSLASNGLIWVDNNAPDTGAYIHIQLYLKINYPRPVILPAIVKSVEKTTQDYKVFADFENLSASVEECLAKLIFRHHRRIVALSRR